MVAGALVGLDAGLLVIDRRVQLEELLRERSEALARVRLIIAADAEDAADREAVGAVGDGGGGAIGQGKDMGHG